MTQKDRKIHCIIVTLTIVLIFAMALFIYIELPDQAQKHYSELEKLTPQAIEKARIEAIKKEDMIK